MSQGIKNIVRVTSGFQTARPAPLFLRFGLRLSLFKPRLFLKVLFIVLLTLSSMPSFAQDLKTAIHKSPVIKGDFKRVQVIEHFSHPLKTQGTFIVAEHKGIVWRVKSPLALLTIMTPKGVFQSDFQGEVSRVPVPTRGVQNFFTILTSLMNGQVNKLDTIFVVKTLKKGVWSLTPKSQNMAKVIHKIDLSIKAGKIQKMVIYKNAGGLDTITFSDVTVGKTLTNVERSLLSKAQ